MHVTRPGLQAPERRDVDDIPATLLFHDVGDFLGKNPDAAHIDVKELVPFFQGKFEGWRPPGRPGVVDQNVDAAEFIHGRLDHAVNILGLGYVTGNRKNLHTGLLFNLQGGRLQVLHLPRGQNQVRTRFCEAGGDEFPDATAPAGDQSNLPVEFKQILQFHGNLLMFH